LPSETGFIESLLAGANSTVSGVTLWCFDLGGYPAAHGSLSPTPGRRWFRRWHVRGGPYRFHCCLLLGDRRSRRAWRRGDQRRRTRCPCFFQRQDYLSAQWLLLGRDRSSAVKLGWRRRCRMLRRWRVIDAARFADSRAHLHLGACTAISAEDLVEQASW